MAEEAKPLRAWPAVERRKLGWAADWQTRVERDKATLAQSLHDNTGGLLVAAVMDITWAENRLSVEALEIRERLVRARAALDVAIDLNRRTIEELRPTLLDNFGVIAALKWHFAEACKAADIACEQHLPEVKLAFSPAAAIGVFRIAQTAIALMVAHYAQFIVMELQVEDDFITLLMRCEGAPHDFSRDDEITHNALASVTGRVKSLGGEARFDASSGVALIICRLPSSHVQSA